MTNLCYELKTQDTRAVSLLLQRFCTRPEQQIPPLRCGMTTQNGSAGPLHQREICSGVLSLKFAAYSPPAASLAPQANRRSFDSAALRNDNPKWIRGSSTPTGNLL